VLSELRQYQRGTPAQHGIPAQSHVLLPGGVTGSALAALVTGADSSNSLAFSLLGDWALVRDQASALRVMTAQSRDDQPDPLQGRCPRGGGPSASEATGRGAQRWSLVTLSGEVFKSDGEVVATMHGGPSKRDAPAGEGRAPPRQYELGTALQDLPRGGVGEKRGRGGSHQVGSFSTVVVRGRHCP